VEKARRRLAALGGVHADASVGDAVHELRRYAQSVDLLVIGSHRYRPIERVLEETTSQQLADEPSSPPDDGESPGRRPPLRQAARSQPTYWS
jgi:nucleotide-binding universal stress UspA family protein